MPPNAGQMVASFPKIIPSLAKGRYILIQLVEVADVFAENTYFYIDDASRKGFLIDPGAEAGKLYDIISGNDLQIEAILLTHGHFDHTGAIQQLQDQLGIPYYISPPGEAYLTNPALNLSAECGRHVVLNNAEFFNDGDFISLRDNPAFGLQVIATPGHTPDSVTFYSQADSSAFVGDTIFKGSPGLTRFPGGNEAALVHSIRNKIMKLPNNTVLYSGHTPPTTVAAEKPLYF